jgi:antitoxin component YwqK of YwqJK toxin-antitoxin module
MLSKRIYKDGEFDGLITEWYENGKKSGEINFKNGKKDGLTTLWYENGKKEYEGNFKNDKLISSKKWNEDGSVKE